MECNEEEWLLVEVMRDGGDMVMGIGVGGQAAANFWIYQSFLRYLEDIPQRTLLQWSRLEVVNAWMRFSAAEWERDAWRWVLFLRWKKSVLVMRLTC